MYATAGVTKAPWQCHQLVNLRIAKEAVPSRILCPANTFAPMATSPSDIYTVCFVLAAKSVVPHGRLVYLHLPGWPGDSQLALAVLYYVVRRGILTYAAIPAHGLIRSTKKQKAF